MDRRWFTRLIRALVAAAVLLAVASCDSPRPSGHADSAKSGASTKTPNDHPPENDPG